MKLNKFDYNYKYKNYEIKFNLFNKLKNIILRQLNFVFKKSTFKKKY